MILNLRMRKFCFAALLLLLAGNLVYGQINGFKTVGSSPVQYAKSEWTIDIAQKFENPYLQQDIMLDMYLTAPSGKKLILPCFFQPAESGNAAPVADSKAGTARADHNGNWRARFTPQETGKYGFYFKLTQAGKPGINSGAGDFIAAASTAKGFLHLAAKNNWTLKFDNGQYFRGIGENLAWESRQNDDSKYFKALHENPKYNYEFMLPSLAAHGGNFYRTWICSWNLPIDWNKGFNSTRYTASDEYFNPSAVSRLDRMVGLSDSLGVYMMLTLGMGAYELRDGGFSATAADFFVNPKSRQRYKNRLRYIIARWGYSPAIAAWELFNEVDNIQFGDKNKAIPADSIVAWHDEMSTYIKATDPYKHLVTTSISHRDLKGLNDLRNIDFNQKHIYKNTSNIAPTINQYEDKFKKPYVIGEYGYEWDWSKNFDDFSAGMDSDFKRGFWYGLFSPTPILPMSWWWEYFDSRGTDAYIKQVRSVSDQMLRAGRGGFQQIAVKPSDGKFQVYALKCGNQLFVYVYNADSTAGSVKLELTTALKFNKLKVLAGDKPPVGYPVISFQEGKLKITDLKLNGNADIVFSMNLLSSK